MIKHAFSLIFCIAALWAWAADPMATSYTYQQCQGSLMPYPTDIKVTQTPDSLTPVLMNHVGRHGSRYPASPANCKKLITALWRADSAGTITPLGKQLKALTSNVMILSDNQWGALDSLGMAEQRLLASRMFKNYLNLFVDGSVYAISSYSPRVMMSMYAFTHQLDRLNNHIEFITTTGRMNDDLMRPFDEDEEFLEFIKSETVTSTYQNFFAQECPTTAIERVLGKNFPYRSDQEQRDFAIAEYYVLAGLSAMSVPCDLSKYFTLEEINALWACFNFRQYLQRTATTVSAYPAEIASYLLLDLINTTDDFINGNGKYNIYLRFGHAETLMPLLSLMRMPGCYYLTNYFDTVAQHWRDFDIVPMAANLQMILFQNPQGKYYVRFDLNEQPVALIPNNPSIYLPWAEARDYLMRCVPIYLQ